MRALALAVLIGLASARSAHAAVWVGWQAPPECGTAAALGERIDGALGRVASPDELLADVAIAIEPGAYRATLAIAGGPPRQLTAATCDEVVDALALVLALAIRDAAPALATTEPLPAPAAPRAPPAVHLELGLRATADARTLPGPAAGVGPAIAIGTRRFRVGLAIAVWTPATANAGTLTATRVRLLSGALEGCGLLGPAQACAIATAGPMTGDGSNAIDGAAATRWWSAIGASAGAHRRIAGRVVIGGAIEALVALARPRYELDSGRESYTAPGATVRAWLGIGFQVP